MDNCDMINYDFDNNELWFSSRALRELVCSERMGLYRHIKKLERNTARNNWRESEAYLPRYEGGRIVYRKDAIYDLDTSYLILSNYQRATPPDFWMVLERIEELRKLRRTRMINRLREKGIISESFAIYGEDDEQILEAFGDFDEDTKKKIILNFANGVFELVSDEKDQESKKLWPRSMFRFAANSLLS